MTHIQRSGGQIALLALSIIGAAIAIYLTTVHYENVPLVCSTQGFIDCARVLASSYSVVPGTTIPITVPGLGWCIVSAVLALIGWRLWPERRSVRVAECVWSALGMITVFYLVYVELVRLHTLCAWCTVLHVIILTMLLISVVQLQQPEYDLEVEAEGEESLELKRVKASNKVR
jgi:uncharacterized membrane protein